MTIASEITKLNTNLTNSYTACQNKGATMPTDQNFDNLATCIGSIQTGGGGSPVITSLNVTPTTSAQTITAPSGIDGYSPVNVSAVTASIDNNITTDNIKAGVTILGVSGSVTELIGETQNVSLTNSSGQIFTPTNGKNGITSITVNPNNEARTVTPTTSQQTLSVNSGYSGNGTITVNAVNSSIDSNITAGNIKNGVSILGVTGNYTGGATLITKNITQNGTYNASDDSADGYSSVTVNVSGGGGTGINREVVNGVYKAPTTSFTWSLTNTATDIGANAMYYAFYQCTGIISANMPSLTNINNGYAMYYAFYQCTNLTSVDLSGLTYILGSNAMDYTFYGCSSLTSLDLSSLYSIGTSQAMHYTFYGCSGLTSLDLSSLTTVTGNGAMLDAFRDCIGLTSLDLSGLTTVSGTQCMGYTFYGCKSLTSVDLSGLTTIGINSNSTDYGHFSNCFYGCINLTTLTFSNLEKIYCTGGATKAFGTFANNNKVQKLYFPKLDTITYGNRASSTNQNACKNVFYGCSALTELHFAAANQAAIEASPGYSTAWGRGAGSVTIYFDL